MKIIKLSLRIALILLIFLLFITVTYSDEPDPQSNDTGPQYYCPPCGCCSDDILLAKEGECRTCGMRLIRNRPGLTGQAAGMIAIFFRENTVSTTYYDRIMYPGYFMGLLIGPLLLLKSRQNRANSYLGASTLVLSLYPFQNRICEMSSNLLGGTDLLFFPISYILLFGPLLYFYTKTATFRDYSLKRTDYLHFLPALIALSFYLFFYFKSDVEKHRMLLSPEILAFSHSEQIIAVLLSFTYLFVSMRFLAKLNNGENGSVSKKKSVVWLKKFLHAVTILLVVWSIVLLVDLAFYDFGMSTLTYYPLWFGIALFLYWIAYQFLFNSKEILNGNVAAGHVDSYGRNLSLSKMQSHAAALTELMEHKKPFLEPLLNLNKLAKQLELKPKDLTIVLNQRLDTNFYDFLNEYRVREAKTRLVDPKNRNLTILAIAFDSGFNSKSSFNAVFKKYVKMTPKEFVQQNRT